jgi:hypothetical protein
VASAIRCSAERRANARVNTSAARRRNHHDAILVRDNDVAGLDADISEANRHVDCLHLDTVLAGPHEAAAGIEGVSDFVGFGGVTTHTIDDGAADAAVSR